MSGNQSIRFVVSLVAAYFFFDAGQGMSDISSVSGDSINEAFYQAFGTLSYGLAVLSVVIGLPANPYTALRDLGKGEAPDLSDSGLSQDPSDSAEAEGART